MAMLFECFISETTFATQANDTKNITNVGSEQSQTAVINSSVLLIVFFLSLSLSLSLKSSSKWTF